MFLNITRNIVNIWKIFQNIYWAKFVQEHRNFRFTPGIWDVSAEWDNLFCTVKTKCRKVQDYLPHVDGYADLSSLSCLIFPYKLKVFQKWFNSAIVFMLQIVLSVWLRPVVSSQGFGVALSFLTVKRKSHIKNYLLNLACSVCTDKISDFDLS